jgi:hypothetical protein
MSVSNIRDWLGKYFLYVTSSLGVYILIFGQPTYLLPIGRSEAMDVLQIIIPTFIAQLTLITLWFTRENRSSAKTILHVPIWLIKGPPTIFIVIISFTILLMIVGEATNSWRPSTDTLKAVVTLGITLLNTTTIYVVARYFNIIADQNQPRASHRKQDGKDR